MLDSSQPRLAPLALRETWSFAFWVHGKGPERVMRSRASDIGPERPQAMSSPCAAMNKINSAGPTVDSLLITRCRELLGEEAVGLSDEQVDQIRQRADVMAHVLIDVFLQNCSTAP